MPALFINSKSPGVPINPYGITGTLSDDRDDVRVNFRREKLEQLPVQQIQNASFKPAFLLNHVRRAKSAFGDLNAKPTRPVFLKLHFPNAMFSSARSVPHQRHETRVTTTKRATQKVRVSQVSIASGSQQRVVRACAQQRRETRILKPKCDSRICSTEHELCVS